MNSDQELDRQLRELLRQEDAELLRRLDQDPGIFEVVRAGFRGRNAWWVYVTSTVQVVCFALAIWTGIRFCNAAATDERVFWGVWLLLSSISMSMLKMMVWSHVERGMLRREIKRLEMQVAALGARLGAAGPGRDG